MKRASILPSGRNKRLGGRFRMPVGLLLIWGGIFVVFLWCVIFEDVTYEHALYAALVILLTALASITNIIRKLMTFIITVLLALWAPIAFIFLLPVLPFVLLILGLEKLMGLSYSVIVAVKQIVTYEPAITAILSIGKLMDSREKIFVNIVAVLALCTLAMQLVCGFFLRMPRDLTALTAMGFLLLAAFTHNWLTSFRIRKGYFSLNETEMRELIRFILSSTDIDFKPGGNRRLIISAEDLEKEVDVLDIITGIATPKSESY